MVTNVGMYNRNDCTEGSNTCRLVVIILGTENISEEHKHHIKNMIASGLGSKTSNDKRHSVVCVCTVGNNGGMVQQRTQAQKERSL